MKMNPTIFRESTTSAAWRGADFVCDFARGAGARGRDARARSPPGESVTMSVGRDCRPPRPTSTPRAMIRGLRDGGVDVVDIGMVPTPLTLTSLALRRSRSTAGIEVTGEPQPVGVQRLQGLHRARDDLTATQIAALRRGHRGAPTSRRRRRAASASATSSVPIGHFIREKAVRRASAGCASSIDAGNGAASRIAPCGDRAARLRASCRSTASRTGASRTTIPTDRRRRTSPT